MKKNILKYLIISCIGTTLLGCLTACGGNRTPNLSSSDTGSNGQSGSPTAVLSSPTDLYLSIEIKGKTEYILTWEEVTNAQSYTVFVGEDEIESQDNRCVLTDSITVGQTYSIEVVAKADGYENSPPTLIEETIYKPSEQLLYTLSGDGYSVKLKSGEKPVGKIVVADRYEEKPVIKIEDNAFMDGTGGNSKGLAFAFTAVRFPRSLAYIGENAFYECDGLKYFNMPKDLKEIGVRAFYGCLSLETDLIFPESFEILGDSSFVGCKKIRKVEIQKELKNDWAYAFLDCENLESVKIANQKNIPIDAFGECKKLTEIELSDDIERIDTGAFYGSGLKKVVLPKNLKIISEETFKDCENLESVTLPNGLEEIERRAFQGCKRLKEIALPESLQTIGEFAFENSGVERVRIPTAVTGSIVGAFAGKSFQEIIIDEQNPAYKTVDGNIYSKDGTVLVQYLTGKTDATFVVPQGVLKIEAYAFYECTALKSVVLPDGLEELGGYAFQGCKGITEIELPDSLRVYTAAFYQIDLKKLVVPAGIEDYNFDGHTIEYVEFSEGITEIKIGRFLLCWNVNLILPKTVEQITQSLLFGKIVAIYYLGTEQEFKEIEVAEGSANELANTKIYYYSENEPTEDGKFWHYDQNGIPVDWE